MKLTQNEYDALLRQDLVSFIQKTFATVVPGTRYLHNWHIEAIAWHLQQVYSGQIKRLIITLPPRSLKSIITSVAFPAWLLGMAPSNHIICVSYSQNLSDKLALDCRAVIETDWYRRIFPGTRLHSDKNSVGEFMTTQRGGRLSTSVGGTLTGRGGNIIILDDPHKADEGVLSETKREGAKDWFRNTLSSRLDNKKEDAIILIQQRPHEDDLAGYLLETGNWAHLNLPAIAEEPQNIPIGLNRFYQRQIGDLLHPERESQHELAVLKSMLGSYNFAAQYQQRPAPMGGGLVKWEWFEVFEEELGQIYGDRIIQSWDTASKAEVQHDWSVCTTWLYRNKRFYLQHVLRERLEYTQLKARIIDHAAQWNTDTVLIEDKGAGISLIQDLRQDSDLSIIDIMPEGDKATRMMTVTPMIESGRVYIPDDASWLADLQHELVNFPKSKYDDQVDSVSQFLNWARGSLQSIDMSILTTFPSIFETHIPGDWESQRDYLGGINEGLF